MRNTEIITGCSSFNETYWKGVFYPEDLPRKDWFAYYSRHFNTYEMNGTFYKFPTDKSLAAWYEKAPEGFLFSVKMYKGITHYKKFRDCESDIRDFYRVCLENLKEKLGCVLFQLPPSFHYSQERLELVLGCMDSGFTNVIEFRHASWWRNEVYAALKQKSVIFCNVSYPGMPEEIIATNPVGYVRLHGVPRLFYSGYDRDFLMKLQQQLLQQGWRKAYVYFNNTASEHGVVDALEFQKLL